MKPKKIEDGVFEVEAHGGTFRVARSQTCRPVWNVLVKRREYPHPSILGWTKIDWDILKTEPTRKEALKWIEQYGGSHGK